MRQIKIILQNFDKKNGSLIYISGELISYNLDKDLISEGYEVKRLINYTVKPIDQIRLTTVKNWSGFLAKFYNFVEN